MSKRRKLTPEEKRKIEAYARQNATPAKTIRIITVQDEMDDDGKVHFTTLYVEEMMMPKNWKP